jgi:hypothetical protein
MFGKQRVDPAIVQVMCEACGVDELTFATARQVVADTIAAMADLDLLNLLVSMRGQEAADGGPHDLWHDHCCLPWLFQTSNLAFLVDPGIERINGIQYEGTDALIGYRTSDTMDQTIRIEDFSLRLHELTAAVHSEMTTIGNNHWGNVADIRMMSIALNIGFMIFPNRKQGHPGMPEGWVYGTSSHRGDFSHWIVLYCEETVHFQLGLIRCGHGAPYQCVFPNSGLPAQLQRHYNMNNVDAPVGRAAATDFV